MFTPMFSASRIETAHGAKKCRLLKTFIHFFTCYLRICSVLCLLLDVKQKFNTYCIEMNSKDAF